MAPRSADSRSPATVSTSQRMLWLSSLVFCLVLGSGNTVTPNNLTPLVVNGMLGESVTLPLELSAEEEITLIIWLHNGIAIVVIKPNKLQTPQFIVSDLKWERRLTFTQASYSLTLNNLVMADAGSYTAQITTKHSVLISSYTVRVFRPLNLQVTNQTQLSGNGTCEIHLTCSVENSNYTVSIGWQASGSILLSEPNLTISWDPKNSSKQNYTCIAENPVSNVSFSVSAQSLCKGVLTEESLPWNSAWIMILASVILIFITVWCFVWRKRTDSLSFPTQPAATSSQRIEYSSGFPGSTVYAQVTHPNQKMEIPTSSKNNGSVTVYSMINVSRENKPRETAPHNVRQAAKRP